MIRLKILYLALEPMMEDFHKAQSSKWGQLQEAKKWNLN
jgi:hypothetical protein